MKKIVELWLIFVFCFLWSHALKAASLENDAREPTVLIVPATTIPTALSWYDVAQSCRDEVNLFIDHTENLLSLTREAIEHLKQTKRLDNYAPLLGFEADNFPIQIKPKVYESYVASLENNASLLNANCKSARGLLDFLSETPVTNDLSHEGFIGHAIIIASALLDNFQTRNKEALTDLSDPASAPIICVSDYKNLLPIEILPRWQYEELHMMTRWSVVKKLWDFINEWDSDHIIQRKKEYTPIVVSMLAITHAFDNLAYLQGIQVKPNIETREMNTPQKILQVECIFRRLKMLHEDSKKYREDLHRKFAKRAAKKEHQAQEAPDITDLPSIDDLMTLIGGNEVPEEPAQPKKAKAKQRVKVHSDTLVKAPDPKAQAKALAASKKKAAINTLVAEVAAAAVAPAPKGEVKQELSVDRQRRREARERRRQENDLKVAAGAHAREAALEKKDARKTKAERESDHALKVTAIASYTARLSKNLDSGLTLLNQAAAEFFHDFYTKSTPVCWWEFCDNFEALGGTIIHKSGSIHIFEWKDPTVAGVVLAKEIHDPHPHYLIGNHYRLHIGRFLNVVRAFRHERMRAYLQITTGKIFDRRTFDEDLIRFWR